MNYHTMGSGASTWSNTNIITAYGEQISYDANGNIKTYTRNGANIAAGGGNPALPLEMDNLTYGYTTDGNGKLLNNKLRHVKDNVPEDNYSKTINGIEDIDNQDDDNYAYDKFGNLILDRAEYIQTNIKWNVYGKIEKISKTPGDEGNTYLDYTYDPSGNRITKKREFSIAFDQTHEESFDFYVRDAQGNVLAVYKNDLVFNPNGSVNTSTFKWMEQHLYGSSRIGIMSTNLEIPTTGPLSNPDYNPSNDPVSNSIIGKRSYELSNHLGNVLSTISDKKIGVNNGSGGIDHYIAEVLSQNDYYPFGMMMPGRKFATTGSYRYGFNGKENDNEVKGEGNQQDYGMRIYDPRLGKFLSVDPLMQSYPWYTPYQFAGNMPILAIDLDGEEPKASNGSPSRAAIITRTSAGTANNSTTQQASKTMNLGFFKLDKKTYDNTSWFGFNPFSRTKQTTFAINSGVSAWNGTVGSIELSYNYITSSNYRKDYQKSVNRAMFKGILWLFSTNNNEKFEDIKDQVTDVSNWENVASSLLLGRILSVNTFIKSGTKFSESNWYLKNAEKNGVKIIEVTSADDLNYMKARGQQAAYMVGENNSGGSIIIMPGAGRAALLEEAMHHFQYRVYGSEYMHANESLMEVVTQRTLLEICKKEGWSKAVMDEISTAEKTHLNKYLNQKK